MTDPDVDRPGVQQVPVTEEGDTSVDRALISGESKDEFARQRKARSDAKTAGDLQAQVDALQAIVDDLWHIVSGETADETEASYDPDQ
ncbi:hypothetical protein JMJ58_19200 [Haloterrigena salifodinae]|uniref:Uncharacterized protein n=1 Tax=Haloterrigena salifodinae TaxID=2675099 RepID=A0A8T8E0R5_9EURY|nr:hypothetical protein [Haloterrigena salifodinae]QRV15010.1 hypothetical protein JMJ58_19200 [Haloterrigena salifodinae]